MKGRCKKCGVVYIGAAIPFKPQDVKCRCGRPLTQTNTHCKDPLHYLTVLESEYVMKHGQIPEWHM